MTYRGVGEAAHPRRTACPCSAAAGNGQDDQPAAPDSRATAAYGGHRAARRQWATRDSRQCGDHRPQDPPAGGSVRRHGRHVDSAPRVAGVRARGRRRGHRRGARPGDGAYPARGTSLLEATPCRCVAAWSSAWPWPWWSCGVRPARSTGRPRSRASSPVRFATPGWPT